MANKITREWVEGMVAAANPDALAEVKTTADRWKDNR